MECYYYLLLLLQLNRNQSIDFLSLSHYLAMLDDYLCEGMQTRPKIGVNLPACMYECRFCDIAGNKMECCREFVMHDQPSYGSGNAFEMVDRIYNPHADNDKHVEL